MSVREATPNVAEARRMLKKGIVIAGVGETEQGVLKNRGSFELLAEVTKITLDDAGISLGDPMGGVVVSPTPGLVTDGRRSSQTLEHFPRPQEIVPLLDLGHRVQVPVIPGVQRDLVPAGDGMFQCQRIVERLLTDPAECRLNIEVGQDAQRSLNAGGVVFGLRNPVRIRRIAIIAFSVRTINVETDAKRSSVVGGPVRPSLKVVQSTFSR